MTEDALNATFEIAGAAFVLLHVRRVWIDQMVRGVSWVATRFFTVWGFWNLSFYAACAIVASNALWVASLLYWRKK